MSRHSAQAPFVTFSKTPFESFSGSEPSPVPVALAAVSVASVVTGEDDGASSGENRYQSKFDTHCCPDGAWNTNVALDAFSRASGSVTAARTVV